MQKDIFAPIMQEDQGNSPKHMGGMFSPLAQYPGAGYSEVFSSGRTQEALLKEKPKPLQKEDKTFVRTKMPMENMQAHSFTSALLLVEVEGNARMDKSALREVGIAKVQVLTSGILAGRFLEHKSKSQESDNIDIIFCHARLEDMSALQFAELVKLNPSFKNIPVVAIVGNAEEGNLFQSIANAFTAIITRPYSINELQKALVETREKLRTSFYAPKSEQVKTEEKFDAVLKRLEGYQGQGVKATMHFNEGLRFLKEKSWDLAIVSLSKVLYNLELKGEAEYGLAVAWQGKNNMDKYAYFMNEACLSLVRTQKWARARHAYTKLLHVMPTALNPFLVTAEGLIRAQQFRDAGATLLLGINLSKPQDVLDRIAKACFYTENISYTLSQIQKNFTASELQPLVQALPQKLEDMGKQHAALIEKKRNERLLLRRKAQLLQSKADPFSLSPFAPTTQNKEEASSPIDLGQPEEVSGKDSFPFFDDEESEHIKSKPSQKKFGLFSSGKKSKKRSDKITQESTSGEKNKSITPLQEEDFEVQFLSKGLNEIATVIKTTWRLMKDK